MEGLIVLVGRDLSYRNAHTQRVPLPHWCHVALLVFAVNGKILFNALVRSQGTHYLTDMALDAFKIPRCYSSRQA